MTESPSPPNFRDLYAQHFAYVCHTVQRLGARTADMQDLVQDVFVVVYRRLHDLDPKRPVRPWLFGITYRVTKAAKRGAWQRRSMLGTDPNPASDQPTGEDALLLGEKRQLILAALGAVEIERRAVFIMHDIDGHSMPEIAATLSEPLNTCYSRLRLARSDFAQAVQRLRARGTSHDRT